MIDSFEGPYRFLSNFWPVQLEYEGLTFPSVEHAFQAAKSTDPAIRRAVAALATPGQAKRAGRKNPMRRDWQSARLGVMRTLVQLKFAQPVLSSMLLATGDAQLVEGNTWGDTYWGTCNGRGENHLGKILMAVRKDLVMHNDLVIPNGAPERAL